MVSGGSGGVNVEVQGASLKALGAIEGVMKWDSMRELVRG